MPFIKRSYQSLVERLRRLESDDVRIHTLGSVHLADSCFDLLLIHLGSPGAEKMNLTVSAGIHGDEPAGVEAAVRFVERHARNRSLLRDCHTIVFPCDNPSGWVLHTRENADGFDLNRQFATSNPAAEVALIQDALQCRCFDLVVELHEDVDARGFYLYELAVSADLRIGSSVIAAVEAMGYPINRDAVIEGLPASNGVISPTGRRMRKTRLPKALYTYRMCGGHVVTLEPPASVLPLEDRVLTLLTGLDIAIESSLRARGHKGSRSADITRRHTGRR